jgi:hypothetical protein
MKTTTVLLALCTLFSVHAVNSQTLSVNCNSYDNACGLSHPPNGFACAGVSPGTPPYTYQWSTGAVHVTSFTHDTLWGLYGSSSPYTVIVTDGAGASGTGSTYVSENGPTLDYGFFGGTDGLTLPCPGTSTGRMIVSTYANCTPGPFSFVLHNTTTGQTWSHTVGCNVPTPICMAVDTFNNLPAGNYVSTLTNAQGCTGSLSVTLPEATSTASNLTVTSIAACGSTAGGQVIAHFNWPNGFPPNFYYSNSYGSTGPIYYVYNFQLALYTSTGTLITSQSYTDTTFSNVAPGNYEVRAEFSSPGGTLCHVSRMVSVAASPLPSASITPAGPTTFCSGGSVILNAVVAVNRSYQWKKGANIISGATLSSYTATTGGNYRVIVTNTVTGCSKTTGSATVVTVNTLPTATITPQGSTTFCAGGSVVLAANTGTGLTYKWKKGSNYISGGTLSSYTVTLGGTYKVEVTNSNGCSKLSAGVVVSVPCREGDIISLKNNLDFSVYPNPNSGEFTIKFLGKPVAPVEIEMTDAIGRVVKRFETNDETVVIKESNLANGIYCLTVRSKDEIVVKKLNVIK